MATIVLSTMVLFDFYAANMHELADATLVFRYAWFILAGVAVSAICLKLALPRFPLWRCLLAVGVTAFVLCTYGAIVGRRHQDVAIWLPSIWPVIAIAAGALALIFLRQSVAASIALILALAFASPSLVRIAAFLASRHESQAAAGNLERSIRARVAPNIYWIVLDGYPRQDVLRETFGFDNSGFVRQLSALDFVVLGNSRANFPATVNSISSTLNMDYTVQRDSEGLRPLDLLDMQLIVKGQSRTVSKLKAMGYTYVHFENGYDYLTACHPREPRCIRGNWGLDELDSAILSNTPLIDLLVSWDALKPGARSAAFAWGGVADVTAKLSDIRDTAAPYFLYAHVLAPHPPIRFHADCSFRPAEPDLQGWSPTARPAFIDQLVCTNTQTLALLRAITTSDPPALIILQSDHGTAFNGQFDKPPTTWTDDDLHERFGNLNALRLPASCRADAADDLTLVDTFPLVLSCLTGEPFRPHTPRFFVTPYDDRQEFGQAFEYPAERVR
ncbi:sulfatase [Bradyrhizobium jicamae]|uniref:sulfatase n=1 Tax=Bradyrhizobium jicamae TaxID=280332 RepID=UPI002011F481|nr:sulfatase [Bradyrhizobium jicamae]